MTVWADWEALLPKTHSTNCLIKLLNQLLLLVFQGFDGWQESLDLNWGGSREVPIKTPFYQWIMDWRFVSFMKWQAVLSICIPFWEISFESMGLFYHCSPQKWGQSCEMVLKGTKHTVGILMAQGFRINLYFWFSPSLLFLLLWTKSHRNKKLVTSRTKIKVVPETFYHKDAACSISTLQCIGSIRD